MQVVGFAGVQGVPLDRTVAQVTIMPYRNTAVLTFGQASLPHSVYCMLAPFDVLSMC